MRAGIAGFLRSLSYWPPIQRAVRALPIRGFLSRVYYGLMRPPDGVLDLEVEGIRAQFYVPSPGELRFLESFDGEKHLFEVLARTLQPGDCLYDIGAGVGLYTVFLAKVVGELGKVIAFEPERYSFGRLQEHLKLNGLTNVRTHCLALGDRTDQGKFCVPDKRGWCSFLQSHESVSGERTEVVAGDLFVRAGNLPLPRAAKIDVEGHEYAVLRGLRETLAQPPCELVCCEIHPRLLPKDVKPEAVLALLRSVGFERIDLFPRANEYHAVAYKRDAAARQR